jgi:hypothetical protein
MRWVVVFLVASVALVGFAISASAGTPKLERLALNRADMRLAAAALLRRADLAGVTPGWRPLSTVPDNSAPVCAWQNYSRYTLTGRGEADFQPAKLGHAGFVGSSVDIFATFRDALGKFTVDTHPGTATCEAEALRKAFGAGLTTISARELARPKLGDRAVAYEFVYEQASGTPKRIFIHIIEFVRGRGVGVLSTTDFDAPGDMATRLRLAGLIDTRLK